MHADKGTVTPVRKALIVRGGADFHQPAETTDSFLPFLEASGFTVEISDSLEVYENVVALSRNHLIIQCWTRGELSAPQQEGLDAAVRSGVGFAGWHGGVVAAFADRNYQWMTGGWFVCHPGDFVEHELTVVKEHPIVDGITAVALHTERYWVLTDPLNDVLATITMPAEDGKPWREAVTHPAVWTRQWGRGRIFVSTVGHHLPDLDVPEIRLLTERGLLWAARAD
jgi:type 1 glutamine amidotransferase